MTDFSYQMGMNQGSSLPQWYQDLAESRVLYNQGNTTANGGVRNQLHGQQMYDNISQDQIRSLVGQRIGNFDGNNFNSDLFGRIATYDTPMAQSGGAWSGDNESAGMTTNPYIRRFTVGNASGQQGENDLSEVFVDTRTGEVTDVRQRSSKEQNRSRNQAALVALGSAGAGAYSAANAAGAAGAAGGGSAGGGTAAGGGTVGGTAAGGTAAGGAVGGAPGVQGAAGMGSAGATGSVVNTGGAAGGGLMSQAGNWLSNNSGMVGAGLGALGSYLDARNQPDTLTSTSSNTATRSLTPEMQAHADAYLGRVSGQSGSNPYIEAGAGMINKAAGDQSLLNSAIGTHGQFMRDGGRNDYSGENPYLENIINRGMDDITRQGTNLVQTNDAVFARGNAFGGSAWRQAQADAARETGDAAGAYQNQMRFGDYRQQQQLDENRLGRQQNAYMAAPALDSARYTAGRNLMQGGQQQFNNQQTVNNAYGNAISGIGGMTGTTTSNSTTTGNNPYQQNPWAAAIGGGLAGYGIGQQIGQPQQQPMNPAPQQQNPYSYQMGMNQPHLQRPNGGY